MNLRTRTVLIATMVAAVAGAASAQAQPAPASTRSSQPTVQDRWPEPPKPPQAERLQSQAQPPAPKRAPAQDRSAPNDQTANAPAQSPPAPAHKPSPRGHANVLSCGGVFAKNSAHLKLAMKYDSRNIVYGKVDGPDGTKINASILFPNDPRRRLEVLWHNEASRSDTSVIAINGKSQWIAPRGLKLGMTIAALEKANHRPFKLTGFGKDGSATVTDWDNGALSSLPGGCKVGMRLIADPKSSDEVRSAAAVDTEMLSNDAKIRAAKPTVAEILIGY